MQRAARRKGKVDEVFTSWQPERLYHDHAIIIMRLWSGEERQ